MTQTITIPGYPCDFAITGETEKIKTPTGKKYFLVAYINSGALKGNKVTNLKTLIRLQKVLDGQEMIKPTDRYQVTTQRTEGGMVGIDKPWIVVDTAVNSETGKIQRAYKNKSQAEKFATSLNSK